jgi:hypothetical protein
MIPSPLFSFSSSGLLQIVDYSMTIGISIAIGVSYAPSSKQAYVERIPLPNHFGNSMVIFVHAQEKEGKEGKEGRKGRKGRKYPHCQKKVKVKRNGGV